MAKKGPAFRYRNAKNGRYVTEAYAKRHRATTVAERTKPRGKKK